MLQITVPSTEIWDEVNQEFISIKGQTLQLEHSLVSISKWESKWHKSFLHTREKTDEQIFDYIKCMTINKDINPVVYRCLTADNVKEINDYINNPMTATCFNNNGNGKKNNEVVTSELIYYWMIALNIPVEFQKWHINRLMTLIRVCEIKNNPPKKMGRGELMRRNAALNASRRKQLNTKG